MIHLLDLLKQIINIRKKNSFKKLNYEKNKKYDIR